MSKAVGVISLGCAKNRVDTEQMLYVLQNAGHHLTQEMEKAEVILVNTCGFIEPAKQESVDAILEAAQYKQKGSCRLLIVTGCLVQRYAEDLHRELPEVDAFLGVSEGLRVAEMIEQAGAGERPAHVARAKGVLEGPRVLTTAPFSAFVRTGDGCDNRCTYCAIPLIRGPYRSRSTRSVLDEVRTLAEGGVSEVSLIAQDTTRFGDDLADAPRLAGLIRDIAKIDGIRWIRALYCYPSRVDEALLFALAEEPKACAYLDLPLQHIDGKLLSAMNRKGTPGEIRAILARAKALGITLRTTFIVGFPGETEAAFERLLAFVEETQFDRLGAFAFSPEENTAAAEMPNQVPEEVKAMRLDRLMRLQQRISLRLNQARVGTLEEALLISREGEGRFIARTRREAPEGDGILALRGNPSHAPGEYVKARIDGCNAYDITGEIVK